MMHCAFQGASINSTSDPDSHGSSLQLPRLALFIKLHSENDSLTLYIAVGNLRRTR